MLLTLIRCELLKLSRAPAFTLPTFLFPILFYALFGLSQPAGRIAGVPASAYLLASFASFSVMSTALFSFGVSIAAERQHGWIRLLRVTPIQPAVYLLAKLVVAMLFSVMAIALLVLFATLTVPGIPGHLFWSLPLRMLAGVLPFSALGMALGLLCAPNAASALANAIFLPLAFASGLFVPLERLPAVLREIAPWLPSYHLGVLGWDVVASLPNASPQASAAILAAFTVVFLLFGLWAYRREGNDRGP